MIVSMFVKTDANKVCSCWVVSIMHYRWWLNDRIKKKPLFTKFLHPNNLFSSRACLIVRVIWMSTLVTVFKVKKSLQISYGSLENCSQFCCLVGFSGLLVYEFTSVVVHGIGPLMTSPNTAEYFGICVLYHVYFMWLSHTLLYC